MLYNNNSIISLWLILLFVGSQENLDESRTPEAVMNPVHLLNPVIKELIVHVTTQKWIILQNFGGRNIGGFNSWYLIHQIHFGHQPAKVFYCQSFVLYGSFSRTICKVTKV